jgi:cytoplasmic tRNA 2-thiolation protein 1
MAPSPCAVCKTNRALILRPKDHSKLCKTCFIRVFETEIHHTITANALFHRGEKVAIGASGGKDSTVLASVLKTLNERYDYGLELVLLSIDEGIRGYRDDSLETVKRNATQYDMPLTILGYAELYGWTMDQVVEQVGKKGNCTYCGVFRRQALDRGAARLGVRHVVTGHNADDVAETVLMNRESLPLPSPSHTHTNSHPHPVLRGDLPRLSRTTSIITSTPSASAANTNIRRSKPLKYAYEKEIVLYAHHKSLDYFSTECIYSPEAFRGSARALIKNLERVRPSAILDVVRSGEDMARLVPGADASACAGACGSNNANTRDNAPPQAVADDDEGGCGSAQGAGANDAMARMEAQLAQNERAAEQGLEVEITSPPSTTTSSTPTTTATTTTTKGTKTPRALRTGASKSRKPPPAQQKMGTCARCGYLSSQAVCKACVLLEGLNKNRPRNAIEVEVGDEVQDVSLNAVRDEMAGVRIGG